LPDILRLPRSSPFGEWSPPYGLETDETAKTLEIVEPQQTRRAPGHGSTPQSERKTGCFV